MQFQPRRFTIEISPIETKYIVYKTLEKPIPIDYHLLKCNSKFFKENDAKYSIYQNIVLSEEEGDQTNFPAQSINDFISCCQNQEIEINLSNIFYLNYLSHKYKVDKLLTKTQEIISENENDLALESLLFNLDPCHIQNRQKNTDLDTTKEENIISEHLHYFINNEKLFLLPISVLYRIVHKHYLNQSLKGKSNNDSTTNITTNNISNDDVDCIDINDDFFINFLFKLFDKRGREASAFLSFLDINKQTIQSLHKLVDCYKDKINVTFLNSSLLMTTVDLVDEMANLKSEFKDKLDEMTRYKEETQKKLDELARKQEQTEEEVKHLKEIIDRKLSFYQSVKESDVNNILCKSVELIPTKNEWKEKKCNNEGVPCENTIEMDANNEHYEVFYSSHYNTGHNPKHLFNGEKEISEACNCWATSASDNNRFIQIKFGKPKVANIVSITSRNYWINQAPTHFEIFGLNEEGQGVQLGKFVQSGWKNNETIIFPFFNEDPYVYYRIKFYEPENSPHIGIAELNLRKMNI